MPPAVAVVAASRNIDSEDHNSSSLCEDFNKGLVTLDVTLSSGIFLHLCVRVYNLFIQYQE